MGFDCRKRDVPAGVGKSLYSTHLDAIFCANHAFIDPNIWYDEQDMRKQIEQCSGCVILIGQEKPWTNRRMRDPRKQSQQMVLLAGDLMV